jgi:hypothetical protein
VHERERSDRRAPGRVEVLWRRARPARGRHRAARRRGARTGRREQISGKEGETFKAGSLGEKKIGANGEVLLGPPTVFDKSNIDQFDF